MTIEQAPHMTLEQITRLKGLLEKATPGPWFVRARPTDSGLLVIEDGRDDGLFPITGEAHEIRLIVEAINALPSLLAAIPVAPTVRPLSEWHEDHGSVLWYRFPIDEPPYVGSPLDLGHTVEIEFRTHETAHIKRYHVGGWPGYHTHWTPITLPTPPTGEGA